MNKRLGSKGDELLLYRAIVENMAEGVLLVQARDGIIVYANPAIELMFGYRSGELVGKHNSIVNAPSGNSPAGIAAEIVQGLNAYESWQGEIQNLKRDGTLLWCSVNVSAFEHPYHGKVWVAIHQDITRRKQIEESLRESELKYRSLIEWSSDSIFCNNEQGQYVFVNQVFASNFGNTPAHFIGKTFWDLYSKEEADFRYEIVKRIIQTGESEVMERKVTLPTRTVFFHTTVNPIKDEAGKVILVLTHATDITTRKQAEDALRASQEELQKANQLLQRHVDEINLLHANLREQVIRDPLTGLYNRRYLDETMERELARAKREDYSVSILMIDIDHFKSFNDMYGHQAGDEMLRALAAFLQENVRQGDIVCRYGGEEFIIIMPGLSEMDAETCAEAIRYNFSNLWIDFAGIKLCTTISIGIAIYPRHRNHAHQLIRSADAALYEAKQAGRNRVALWKGII